MEDTFYGFSGSSFGDVLVVPVDGCVIAAMFRVAALGQQQVVEERHTLQVEGEPAGEFYRVPEVGWSVRCGAVVPEAVVRRSVRSFSGKPGQQRAGAALRDTPLDKHRLLLGQVKGRLIRERPWRIGQARMPIRLAREDDARVVRRLFRDGTMQKADEVVVVPFLGPFMQQQAPAHERGPVDRADPGRALRPAAGARLPPALAPALPARGLDRGIRAGRRDRRRVAGGGPAGAGRDRGLCDRAQPAGMGVMVVAGAARLTAADGGPAAQQGGRRAWRRRR